MEELTEILETELAVSAVPNDPVRKHPRFALYKAHNKRPDQEERRRRLLEQQKKKRGELFDTGRNLITPLEENDVADVENEKMDWSSSRFQVRKIPQILYKNQLMFSEWLVEVPEDIEKEWYMVPCPEGHRTIVVAYKGRTLAFSKSGYNTATFTSLLPGGSHEAEKGCTKLDCIWSLKDHTYYILDVLSWGNQSVMDCETEFRFYWLKTKLQDIDKLGTQSKQNKYIFKSLPYYKCIKDVMTEVMSNEYIFSKEGPRLDGLLFYHTKTHYMPGFTPLVGWLKPYMMPEMLGVQVAQVYVQEDMETKPINTRKARRHTRHKHKTEAQENMETTSAVECDHEESEMVHDAD